MTEEHLTTIPEQAQTDTWAVFGDRSAQLDPHNDLVLIGRVEVPRYTQSTVEGVRMAEGKRLTLAVYRAVQNSPHDPHEGEEFMVMQDMEEPMAFVSYENNPSFDAVWNPEDSK